MACRQDSLSQPKGQELDPPEGSRHDSHLEGLQAPYDGLGVEGLWMIKVVVCRQLPLLRVEVSSSGQLKEAGVQLMTTHTQVPYSEHLPALQPSDPCKSCPG